MDHLLTLQRAKCGPLIDPTIYIYLWCFVLTSDRVNGIDANDAAKKKPQWQLQSQTSELANPKTATMILTRVGISTFTWRFVNRDRGVSKDQHLACDCLACPCAYLGWGAESWQTDLQQLTRKLGLCNSVYLLFFSFVLVVLRYLVLEGIVMGEGSKFVWKVLDSAERFWNNFAPHALPWSFPSLIVHEVATHTTKSPTQIKTQFAQT